MFRVWNLFSLRTNKILQQCERIHRSSWVILFSTYGQQSTFASTNCSGYLPNIKKKTFSSSSVCTDSSFAIDYHLPEDRIAKTPTKNREESKLLFCRCMNNVISDSFQNKIVDGQNKDQDKDKSLQVTNDLSISHSLFEDFPKLLDFLSKESLDRHLNKGVSVKAKNKGRHKWHLIFNSSKVVQARLFLRKAKTGGKAQVMCLRPIAPSFDPGVAMKGRSGEVVWECLISGKNIQKGSELIGEFGIPNEILLKYSSQKDGDDRKDNFIFTKAKNSFSLFLKCFVETKEGKQATVRSSWELYNTKSEQSENGNINDPIDFPLSFGEVLELVGSVPLPPYMNREEIEDDKNRYQTVYARHEGSVAAPTAGLHFTPSLLNELQHSLQFSQVSFSEVVLHVGAGTFLPIPDGVPIEEHQMHSEIIEIKRKTIEELLESVKNDSAFFLPIGTTSVRTLESLYWIGTILKVSSFLDNFGRPNGATLSVGTKNIFDSKESFNSKTTLDLDFHYDAENMLFSLGQWDCYRISKFFDEYPNIVTKINRNETETELLIEETSKDANDNNNDEECTSSNGNIKSKKNIAVKASVAFQQILEWMEERNTETFHASTQLMIRPGYKFAMCDALMTNFHQPKSTLLLLVSAILGNKERTMTVYNYALKNDFRFLSYGDSSILLPPKDCLLSTKENDDKIQ